VVTSTLVFEGRAQVNEYVGGYSDWLRQRRAGAAAPPAAAPPAPAPQAARAASRGERLSYKEQRELEAMPESIQRLEAEQLALQTALADAKSMPWNSSERITASERLRSLATEIENAYARWDALES
jgi:ATP-binding cassette subfamily F protein uup